jgi:hypothetical protein
MSTNKTLRKPQYTVLTVRDGILRVSLNLEALSRNDNKKIASSSKNRVVVQGEFLEVFPNDVSKPTERYLAKVFSIKEDVIEAVLLADDRPVKERFLARFTGTTGRVKVGFDLLGRTVDALGQLLDNLSQTTSVSSQSNKNRLKKFFNIINFLNAEKKGKFNFVNNFVYSDKYLPFDNSNLYGDLFERSVVHHLASYLNSSFPKTRLIFLINSIVSAKRISHYNSIFYSKLFLFLIIIITFQKK